MPTGFFKVTRHKKSDTPPVSVPVSDLPPRARFETEEYWNRLRVPETLIGVPSGGYGEMHTPFAEGSQARMVTQRVEVNGRMETVQHVVVGGVAR